MLNGDLTREHDLVEDLQPSAPLFFDRTDDCRDVWIYDNLRYPGERFFPWADKEREPMTCPRFMYQGL